MMGYSKEAVGRLLDLDRIEVEQLLPMPGGASVAVRCYATENTMMLGQLTIEQARALAVELMSAAARAEYEADFDEAAAATGYSYESVTEIVGLIRSGERDRRAVDGSSQRGVGR